MQIQNLPADQVLKALGSSPEGLSAREAAERLGEVGRNSIEVRDPWRIARSLLRQFSNFFTLLLFGSSAICFYAESLQPGQSMALLGWALGGVALLNALFSFVQEYRAEKAMEALRGFLPQTAETIRDGRSISILVEELTPGDLLFIKEGDRVPADARLISVEGLLVNNAPLTGESQPVLLTADPVDQHLIESTNIIFAGCLVLRGTAQGVVFATGLRTEFGKLAHLSQAISRAPSPLERQTAHMVRVLTIIAVSLGASFFLYGVFSGRSLWVNLVFMMGIIVANVPEGLLPTFTLALAMGSLRMARKNVLVTSLDAVEALGAVQVICTDKTGTLTLNQLSVTRLVPAVDQDDFADERLRRQLLEMAICASEVHLSGKGYAGDPLDVAIAGRLQEEGGDVSLIEAERQESFVFDVEKKRAAGIARINSQTYFAVKGAWEALRPMLAQVVTATGEMVAAGDEVCEKAEKKLTEMAASGFRVVAVAFRQVDEITEPFTQEQYEKQLVLAGFLGVEDPLRGEVPAALEQCHAAGIEVILITGDHPDTALNVALSSGIVDIKTSRETVMTGELLEKASEREVVEALQSGIRIFARTTPAQKMKIVFQNLQILPVDD
jgi:sodium/potassium-transporting ATPase subunit alpha